MTRKWITFLFGTIFSSLCFAQPSQPAEWSPTSSARKAWMECVSNSSVSMDIPSQTPKETATLAIYRCDNFFTEYLREVSAVGLKKELDIEEDEVLNALSFPQGAKLLEAIASEVVSNRDNPSGIPKFRSASASQQHKIGLIMIRDGNGDAEEAGEAFIRMSSEAGNHDARCTLFQIYSMHAFALRVENLFASQFYLEKGIALAKLELKNDSPCMRRTVDEMQGIVLDAR